MLGQLRIKALREEFISKLMLDLEAEGFSFRDLLLALADWAEANPEWQLAAYHLEQAATPPPNQSPNSEQSDSAKAEQA